jgi:hypothetical protein
MSAVSKLNLRPQERRLVAFVAIVLFVVLNIWLVWPHFGDWGKYKMKQFRAKRDYDKFRAEITKVPGYRVRLAELESAGSSVVLEEQDLDFARHVDNQARLNRLTVIQSDPRPRVTADTQTNSFFEEQYLTLQVTSGTEELVNFLVSLTSTNSMIRVKDLTLKPDLPAVTKLNSHMTLVASYQRTPSVRKTAAAPPRTTAASRSKPATPTTTSAAAKPAGDKPAADKNPVIRTPARIPRPTAQSALSNRVVTANARPTNQLSKKP